MCVLKKWTGVLASARLDTSIIFITNLHKYPTTLQVTGEPDSKSTWNQW